MQAADSILFGKVHSDTTSLLMTSNTAIFPLCDPTMTKALPLQRQQRLMLEQLKPSYLYHFKPHIDTYLDSLTPKGDASTHFPRL